MVSSGLKNTANEGKAGFCRITGFKLTQLFKILIILSSCWVKIQPISLKIARQLKNSSDRFESQRFTARDKMFCVKMEGEIL
jgi:hypothetical protein